MEENSPEKPSETPSMRASRKSAAASVPPRRSARLLGQPPEHGLYEMPARSARSAHLPLLEIEDKDSASSAVSSLGSTTSKREAEDDPDQSPQSQVPTKMPAVESPPQEDPTVIVIDDSESDSDEEKSGQPETSPTHGLGPDHETRNQFDEPPARTTTSEPRVEHADDELPLVPADQAKILARFSEIHEELVPQISRQVLESVAEIHRQGYESFLLQQQVDQSVLYRRYAEQLESERGLLRLENQQSHVLISQAWEQCRANEEARIATFVAAMSHLQQLFDDRLRAWTSSIREAFEQQLVEREQSTPWANTISTESPEFQLAVQAAVMAERQALLDQLAVVRREYEVANRTLDETKRTLTHSKSESDFLERKIRGLEEIIASTEQEKGDEIGSLTLALHTQRAEHESELARIRAEYDLYIQTSMTKPDPDLDLKTDSEALRLTRENEILVAERENLLQMKADWELERRHTSESLEIAEATISSMQTELGGLKTQHEDDLRRIRATQLDDRRQEMIDASALKSRDQVLSSQVERLSRDLAVYKNNSEQSDMKVNQLQLTLRSKEDLIRALETNLKLRSSPKNPSPANCQVCPGLKSKLEESDSRIQTLIQSHAHDLSEAESRAGLEWKEQCLKLEALSSSALEEVERYHQKLLQADEEIKESTTALRELKVQMNEKDESYQLLFDRYELLSTTFKAVEDEGTDTRAQLDEALLQLEEAKDQTEVEIEARDGLAARYEGQITLLQRQLQLRPPQAWTDLRHRPMYSPTASMRSTSAVNPGHPSRQNDTSRYDLGSLSHQSLPPGMKTPLKAEIPRTSDIPVYMAKTELETPGPRSSPTRFSNPSHGSNPTHTGSAPTRSAPTQDNATPTRRPSGLPGLQSTEPTRTRHGYGDRYPPSDPGGDGSDDPYDRDDDVRGSRGFPSRTRAPDSQPRGKISFSDVLKLAPKLTSSAVRDQIEHFLTRVRDFKRLHEIPDYEILEAVDRRITESNHPKVSIWWAQKNKKSPFKTWDQAQIALRQTFVDKARLSTVKVFTERGQQQRNESLREYATRLHEAAQESGVPDVTAVDILLSGAYDKSSVSILQNAENRPKTLDDCINYLRRRDIDVEISPEKEEGSRSAQPKPVRIPARTPTSPKPESVNWEGPIAELRRENQLMEARMMQKLPTVIASLMTTTQTNASLAGSSNSSSTPGSTNKPRLKIRMDDDVLTVNNGVVCGRCLMLGHPREKCYCANLTCTRCRVYGHVARECSLPGRRGSQNSQGSSNSNSPEVVRENSASSHQQA